MLEYSKSTLESRNNGKNFIPWLAIFTGPHGVSLPVEYYETILMIASGSGIFALLPYLQQLIYRYDLCKTYTRRIHLVWQLETVGKLWNQICSSFCLSSIDIGEALRPLLDKALHNDGKHRKILKISIFIKYGIYHKFSRRVISYEGTVDLERILQEEISNSSNITDRPDNKPADLENHLQKQISNSDRKRFQRYRKLEGISLMGNFAYILVFIILTHFSIRR